jgi:2-polyprenyl-6-methoxyphenol hydroxylase-like FAD-dependent oxidoreductase
MEQLREEVLVVGAGPVGLTLAAELYRHGVPCRIVDKSPSACPDSRATDVQARTLEMLQDMGLVEEALSIGSPHNVVSVFADGRWLARLPLDKLDSPFPYALGITQDETERILGRHLERLGGKLERGVEVARVEPEPGGAKATLLYPDGRWEKVRARWVVGCDGASSAVRIGLGLPFDGSSYEERFMMGDVKLTWDEPHDHIYVFYGTESFVMILPLPGDGTVRLFMDEPHGEPPLTLETFREMFARAVPIRATLERPGWMSRFRIHSRIVPKYRVGNVFLAGDAAHIHSPATGQGMNLGMHDAYNLAWKLALVARGRAPESLLDSYEPERRPIANAVIAEADRGQRRAMIKGRFGQALRNQVLEIMTSFPSLMNRISATNAQISFNYRGSPIVAEERTGILRARLLEDRMTEAATIGDWREFDAAPAAGDRVPDVAFGGVTLFELLRGTHHTLLLFDGRAPTSEGYLNLARLVDRCRSRFGDLVRPVAVVMGPIVPAELEAAHEAGCAWLDPEGQLHARFGAGAECLYLVRPDGYVGFRAQPAAEDPLVRYLARVLL